MPYLPESGSLINQDLITTGLPVVLTVVFYCAYWFLTNSKRLKAGIYGTYEPLTANVLHVLLKRFAGFFLLGVIPVALYVISNDNYTLADAGLGYNTKMSGFVFASVVLISMLIIPVVSFNARKPAIFEIYPEIRVSRWTVGLLFTEIITWAIYLLGYEALFRGVLLFGLADQLGPVPAVAVNIILYSAAHLPKGKTETLEAIPFGLVLCILTLHSGSIWIAFVAHLVSATTATVTAIKFNPVMSYANRNEKASPV